MFDPVLEELYQIMIKLCLCHLMGVTLCGQIQY